MSEHDEQIAKLRAAFDQFAAASKEVAAVVAGYHKELIANGIDQRTAIELAQNYQTLILTLAMQQTPSEPEQ